MSSLTIKIERFDDDCEVAIETSYFLQTTEKQQAVQNMAKEITELYIQAVVGRDQ
jgi:hypothetical protein